MIRALILYFNGVIIDDEPIHVRLLSQMAAAHGLIVPGGDPGAVFLGRRDEECFAEMLAAAGRPAGPEEIARLCSEKDGLYLSEIAALGIPFFAGIGDFVESVAARWPLAIASGAAVNEIEYVLTVGGLAERFAAIAGGNEPARGKPAPDVYLLALAKLNRKLGLSIPPEACLAIEDSPVGLQSARAAGMLTLGVANTLTAGALAADVVVGALAGLTADSIAGLFGAAFSGGRG
jgi:beta-phosphoglucomutase